MATFEAHDPKHALLSVADAVREVETTHGVDVHTITLTINGQHGEFDLIVDASDQDMEEHRFTGIVERRGGVSGPNGDGDTLVAAD